MFSGTGGLQHKSHCLHWRGAGDDVAGVKMNRTPVTLIDGLSQSQRLRVLDQLTQDPRRRNCAIFAGSLEDKELLEFGHSPHAQVAAEGNVGCAIYRMNGDLVKVLLELHAWRVRREIPAFSRLFVDAASLRESFPVSYTLSSDLRLLKIYEIAGVIASRAVLEKRWWSAEESEWAGADSPLIAQDRNAAASRQRALADLFDRFAALGSVVQCSGKEFDISRLPIDSSLMIRCD